MHPLLKWGCDPLVDFMRVSVVLRLLQYTFQRIGGLREQMAQLVAMVMKPVLLRGNMRHYEIRPHRGLLFHGPPGMHLTRVYISATVFTSKSR